jgi:hypothetical protein
MKKSRPIPVYDADKIIGFVFINTFGFGPTLRTRNSRGNGNKHTIMPICSTLKSAVNAIIKVSGLNSA